MDSQGDNAEREEGEKKVWWYCSIRSQLLRAYGLDKVKLCKF
jgi:hypothetical protein